jgi:pyochelin biosynthetic protein PchC
VLVIPLAAAGPGALRPLLRRFPDDVEVLGVTLPGREARLAEPFVAVPADPDSVVDAILEETVSVADLPIVLLGHSVGAAVALATALRAPHLFAGVVLSATPAPPTAERLAGRWTEQELLDILRCGGATPDEVLSSRSWQRHTLDLLRCDLTLGARLLAGTSCSRLDLPLTLLGGDADEVAPDTRAVRSAVRSARPPRVRVFPGGHFYLLDESNLGEVVAVVGDAAWSGRASGLVTAAQQEKTVAARARQDGR